MKAKEINRVIYQYESITSMKRALRTVVRFGTGLNSRKYPRCFQDCRIDSYLNKTVKSQAKKSTKMTDEVSLPDFRDPKATGKKNRNSQFEDRALTWW